VKTAAARLAATSDRPGHTKGIALTPLARTIAGDTVGYSSVKIDIARDAHRAIVTMHGPTAAPPATAEAMHAQGDQFWPLRAARELDDAILHLRLNELDIGTVVFKSEGDPAQVLAYDALLEANRSHWLVREIVNYWKRVLKRIDVTSRSLVALIEPGSCFAGTLAEIVLACDRSFMLSGTFPGDNRPAPVVVLGPMSFGPCPMPNGLTRLETRFLGEPRTVEAAQAAIGKSLDGTTAEDLGLITTALDHVDWEDEVRIFLEERGSFSADGLTGLEANLRFAGPETIESKIFGRLSAWQNWIFQRPNAVGDDGALKRYGSGVKPRYNRNRV
jgi:benzoyl-CoA-dihydrodiol lyase